MNGSGVLGRRVAAGGLTLAVLGALALALSGLGHRWGWWGVAAGFAMLRGSAYGGLVAAAVGLVGLVLALRARSWPAGVVAGLAVLIALSTAAVPVSFMRTARRVPPIHDITTDTVTPPRFVAILAARRGAPNSIEYAGEAVAAQQRRAYPDIGPLLLAAPPDRVFGTALAVVRRLGWEMVAAVPTEGRLEATDTTPWFGFKDDVVVRVMPADRGSRVDVRSVSRVGRSDLGVNARRIRAFLEGLRAAIR